MTLIFIFLAPFFIGFTVTLLSQKVKKTGALLFHRLSDKFPISLSQVSVKQFEFFCKEVSASAKRAVVFSQYSMGEDELSIVFDDGDKSVYDFAFPILKKYNLTATLFVATGICGGKNISDFYNTQNMMSAENIKELSDSGWEIASHGVGHLDLTLLGESDLRRELLDSKAELEKLCGKTVIALSFPYGSWNDKVVKVAEECGYKKFAVYRRHKFADNYKIIPVTAVYPFDGKAAVKRKISAEIKGITKASAAIVPHFAKGTPIFFWNKLYDGKKS